MGISNTVKRFLQKLCPFRAPYHFVYITISYFSSNSLTKKVLHHYVHPILGKTFNPVLKSHWLQRDIHKFLIKRYSWQGDLIYVSVQHSWVPLMTCFNSL